MKLKARQEVLIADLCGEIDYLSEKLAAAQKEAENWRNKYADLIDRDLRHGQIMMHQLVTAIIDGGIK